MIRRTASLCLNVWVVQSLIYSVGAFTSTSLSKASLEIRYLSSLNSKQINGEENKEELTQSRREAIKSATTSALLGVTFLASTPTKSDALNINPLQPLDQISNGGKYEPAKRATAYLVDSTIPPTLVPFRASREAAILKQLGSGLGTQKSPFIEDKLNLNNIMNKAVFGSINLVKDVVGPGDGEGQSDLEDAEAPRDDKKKKAYDASFVFLGVDYNDDTNSDTDLAIGLITDIIKPRRGLDTAVALRFVPLSMQSALDTYLSASAGADAENSLMETFVQDGQVPREIVENQMPLLKFAKSKQLSLIACAPELTDVQTVRTEGLQNVDGGRRANYVVDAEGFIAWTQDPKNRMYTEKSLLKDFVPLDERDAQGNYFAQKILEHETMATSIAKYAVNHPKSLVLGVAPIKDVRFMGGPNGRLPRICKALRSNVNIDEEAVTTILLNPSAQETLSKSKFLRLEIGTAPTLVQYQTKVADYLWFSTMPKVNMIPRLMNGS